MTHEKHCPFHAVYSDDQILQPCSGCEAIRAAVAEQKERDAEVYKMLAGAGDKPTDRLIGYEECAAAILEQQP